MNHLLRQFSEQLPTEDIIASFAPVAQQAFGTSPEQEGAIPIIIPVLHEADDLPRLLSALSTQELPSSERLVPIVVSDKGTDEPTIDSAEAMSAIVVHSETRGQVQAVQTGFRFALESCGVQTVLLTGADTLPNPNWAHYMFNRVQQVGTETGGLVCGGVTFHEFGQNPVKNSVHTALATARNISASVRGTIIPRGNNMAIHVPSSAGKNRLTSLYDNLRLPHGAMEIEDLEIHAALRKEGIQGQTDLSQDARVYSRGDRYHSFGDMLRRIIQPSEGFARLYSAEADRFSGRC